MKKNLKITRHDKKMKPYIRRYEQNTKQIICLLKERIKMSQEILRLQNEIDTMCIKIDRLYRDK